MLKHILLLNIIINILTFLQLIFQNITKKLNRMLNLFYYLIYGNSIPLCYIVIRYILCSSYILYFSKKQIFLENVNNYK